MGAGMPFVADVAAAAPVAGVGCGTAGCTTETWSADGCSSSAHPCDDAAALEDSRVDAVLQRRVPGLSEELCAVPRPKGADAGIACGALPYAAEAGIAECASGARVCVDAAAGIEDSRADAVVEWEVDSTLERHRAYLETLERDVARSKVLDTPGLATAGLLEELAATCGILGMPERQLRVLRQAGDIHERREGLDGPRVARTLASSAAVYQRLGQVSQEMELRERALGILEGLFGVGCLPRQRAHVADAMAQLADACGRQGDHRRRLSILVRASELEAALFGASSCRAARVRARLGKVCAPEASVGLLQESLGVLQAEYGWRHPLVVDVLEAFGNAHGQLGRTDILRKCLENALAIKEPLYGMQHPEVAVTLVSLACAYSQSGEEEERNELCERAVRLVESNCAALAPRESRGAACLQQPAASDREVLLASQEAEASALEATLHAELDLAVEPESAGALASLDAASYGSPSSLTRRLRLLRQAVRQLERLLGPTHRLVARAQAALDGAGPESRWAGSRAEPPGPADARAEFPVARKASDT